MALTLAYYSSAAAAEAGQILYALAGGQRCNCYKTISHLPKTQLAQHATTVLHKNVQVPANRGIWGGTMAMQD